MIVEVKTHFHLVQGIAGPLSLDVPTSLRYDPSDPYAVTVEFIDAEGIAPWMFARDLLAEGCERKAGELDVQIWPGPPGLLMRLSSPDGVCLFVMPRRDVSEFLRRSFALVPRGREHEHLRSDEAFAKLLAGM